VRLYQLQAAVIVAAVLLAGAVAALGAIVTPP
jgi:hypothetical protein